MKDSLLPESGKVPFDFAALKNKEKSQSVKDEAAYQDLLRSIAADECTLSQEEVLRIIERADADAAQLEADVRWRKERDAKIAELRKIPEYKAKRDELDLTLQKLSAEFAKQKTAYEAKYQPVYWERQRVNEQITLADRLTDELYDTCRNVRLKLEYDVLCRQWDFRIETELYDRHRAINDRIGELQRRCEKACQTITVNQDELRRSLKEELRTLEQESAAVQTKKNELAKQKTNHENALEALRQQMIFS